MIAKIPSALLVTRIGGNSEAHTTRKFNFLAQAPRFLQSLVLEFGALASNGDFTSTSLPCKESGKVAYDSEFLKLEMYEDPLRVNGLRLHFRVINAAGTELLAGARPVIGLAKNAALFELVQEIRDQLQLAKASLH